MCRPITRHEESARCVISLYSIILLSKKKMPPFGVFVGSIIFSRYKRAVERQSFHLNRALCYAALFLLYPLRSLFVGGQCHRVLSSSVQPTLVSILQILFQKEIALSKQSKSKMSDSTRPAKKMKFDLGDFGRVVGVEPVSTNPLWRLDPAVSHPDYKIIVKSISGSRETESYDVHKVWLSNGKRRSLYFVKLFQSAGMKEHKDSQCVIEMDEMAADVFPVVLDFIYSNKDDPITINSKTAVPLRFLANYLSIEVLYDEVNKFIQEDLKVETASTYLEISSIFQDHKVGAAAFPFCPVDDLHATPPDFFKEIAIQSNCDSLLLSKRVADYGSSRWENTSQGNVWLKDFLPDVTNEAIMPKMDAGSALPILKLAVDANVDADYSQSLVERCVESLKEEIKYSEADKYSSNLQARVEALDDLTLMTQVKVLKEMWQKASLELHNCSVELQKVIQSFRRVPAPNHFHCYKRKLIIRSNGNCYCTYCGKKVYTIG